MRTSTLLFAIISVGALVYAQDSKYNRLVWQDEFDGDTLDRAKWQYENHCSPQNQELQCYTPRTNNVYVQNGNLHIKAIPETYGNKRFTSGRINTKHSAAWKYGRFEVRAKLPKGDFLWPAFWMLPRDYVFGGWAASGEIDIMEYRGQKTRQISNALHYGGAWPNNAHVGSGPLDFNFDFSEGYHTFTLIWERDQMQWFVDGKVIATRSLTRSWYSGRGKNPYTDIRQPFDQPFFFLINMATGGNFFGAESQSLTTAIGQRWQNPVLMVDYVRVYQEGGVNPNPIPVPSTAVRSSVVSQASTKATVSVGVSRVASSDATSAVSSAASSAVTSAESSAGTTFVYTKPQETKVTPTVTEAEEEEDSCNGKCGAASCCPDQKLGTVCFSQNTHVCATDSSTGRKSLCGKGSGACNSVCFNNQMYKCENGAIRLL